MKITFKPKKSRRGKKDELRRVTLQFREYDDKGKYIASETRTIRFDDCDITEAYVYTKMSLERCDMVLLDGKKVEITEGK